MDTPSGLYQVYTKKWELMRHYLCVLKFRRTLINNDCYELYTSMIIIVKTINNIIV